MERRLSPVKGGKNSAGGEAKRNPRKEMPKKANPEGVTGIRTAVASVPSPTATSLQGSILHKKTHRNASYGAVQPFRHIHTQKHLRAPLSLLEAILGHLGFPNGHFSAATTRFPLKTNNQYFYFQQVIKNQTAKPSG